MSVYKSGQLVRAKTQIDQEGDDYYPYRVLAKKGDLLIVRESGVRQAFPVYVSLLGETDYGFGVTLDEVEPIEAI